MSGSLGRRIPYVSLWLIVLLSVAGAATVRPMTVEALIKSSEYVVYGRVLGNHCVWDDTTRTIWTLTELLVLDGPKGRTGSTVIIRQPGGVLGNVGQLFPGVPRFEPNQEVVVFLNGETGRGLRVTGLHLGVYLVAAADETRVKMVRPAVPQPEPVYEEGRIAAPQRWSPVAGTRLDEFLSTIRRKARP